MKTATQLLETARLAVHADRRPCGDPPCAVCLSVAIALGEMEVTAYQAGLSAMLEESLRILRGAKS